MENEEIHLVRDDNLTVDKLSEQMPKDAARYHLYSFSHKYDGSMIHSVGELIKKGRKKYTRNLSKYL